MVQTPASRGGLRAAVLVALAAWEGPARGEDFFLVAGGDGTGAGTLRHAILQANLTPEDDTIHLGAGDYPLSIINGAGQENAGLEGDLDVFQGAVTIVGAGAGTTSVRMTGVLDRVFHVRDGASLRLTALTVRDGVARDDGTTGASGATAASGGGVLCVGCGDVVLTDVRLLDNHAVAADGILPDASGQSAYGGAVAQIAGGELRLLGSTVLEGGRAEGGDGGPFVDGSGSAGPGNGGCVYVEGGLLTIAASIVFTGCEALGGAGGDGASIYGGDGGQARGGAFAAVGATFAGLGTITGSFARGGAGGRGAAGGAGNGGVGMDGGSGGTASGGGAYLEGTSGSATGGSVSGCAALGGPAGAGGVGDNGSGSGGSGGNAWAGALYLGGGAVTLTSTDLVDARAQGADGGVAGDAAGGGGSPGTGGAGGGAFGGAVVVGGAALELVQTSILDSLAAGGAGGSGGAGGGAGGPTRNASGGGIYAEGPTALSLRDSTVARNRATGGDGGAGGAGGGPGGGTGFPILGGGFGGGLYVTQPEQPVTIVNSTISGNAAIGSQGGAMGSGGSGPGAGGGGAAGGNIFANHVLAGNSLVLSNSTVARGSATGGAGAAGSPDGPTGFAQGGNIAVAGDAQGQATSTLLADGVAAEGPDVLGAIVLCASLLEDPADAAWSLGPGPGCASIVDVDLELLALADNGGPTLTHALVPGSPPVDQGANPLGLVQDQRLAPYPRAVGVTDIGAYELGAAGPALVTVSVAPAEVAEGDAGGLVFTFARTDSQDAPLAAPLDVCFAVGGTATSGADYSGVTSGLPCGVNGMVTFAAHALTATVTVIPLIDGTTEPTELVVFSVLAGAGYIAGTPAAASGAILASLGSVVEVPTLGAWGLFACATLLAWMVLATLARR